MKLISLKRLIILIVSCNPGWAASWTAINTGLPTTITAVRTLTIDPATPSTLYVCSSTGRVYKSTNGGGTWKEVTTISATSLAVDPQDSSTLYAATNHGVAKSADGGQTWMGANTGITSGYVPSVVIDPITPSTIYAVASGGIFKSTNGAGSWNAITTGPWTRATPRFLAIDPVTPSTVYAVAWDGSIFKTTDASQSWTAIKLPQQAGFADSVLVLTIDPVAPSTLYAGSFADFRFNAGIGSISKSTDGGQTWIATRAGIPSDAFVRSVAIDPASPSTLYASYSGDSGWGILKSTDGGQNWKVLNTGLPPYHTASLVAISATAPSTVYTGYADLSLGRGRLLKSADGGASWDAADSGLTYIALRALAADPENMSTLYAGLGAGGGIFKTADSGANWSKLAQFQSDVGVVDSVLVDFSNPEVLYASTSYADHCSYLDNLLFKSTDGGAHWSDRVSPPMSGCILSDFFGAAVVAMPASDPNTLYAGGDDDCGGTGFYQSADSGANWRQTDFAGHLYALVIDPADRATLYGGTSGYDGVSGGVLKSTDGGVTWKNVGLKDTVVRALAMDPTNSSILYAAAEAGFNSPPAGFRGLFKSTDGGAGWSAIGTGLEGLTDTGATVTALVIDPSSPSVLYAGTSGYGVFRTVDGGANWRPFNDGLTDLNVQVLIAAPGASHSLYAGNPDGVFRIEVGSAVF
jgi:photosystem II stability/assembly factor-like uncharacterized protein